MSDRLIAPHGGTLIDRTLSGVARRRAFEEAHALPRLHLSERNIADLECIATGVYSPLEGFVSEEEYDAIIDHMRLPNGLAWTVPVTLQIEASASGKCAIGSDIALASPNGHIVAVMTIASKYEPDQEREATHVYGAAERAHPGVAAMYDEGSVYLGGPIRLVGEIPREDNFDANRLTPIETREKFERRGWKSVVAFQTRNPIHRAHEFITKAALELVDGLFLHPLVGSTKSDDIAADVRMRCYEVLLERYYNKERTVLGVFPAAMRYAGPREAIMHAIARQNYGCSHFIVGRDHAGVGKYYGTYDAQRLFDRFSPAELAVTPLKFENAFWCTRTQTMATEKTSPSSRYERVELSGTQVRQMLLEGISPPPEFSRPEVAAILIDAFRKEAVGR